jgi:hypothetical protein
LLFTASEHTYACPELTKEDPRLQKVYTRIMEEFDNGRQTSVEWKELEPTITHDIVCGPGQRQEETTPVHAC